MSESDSKSTEHEAYFPRFSLRTLLIGMAVIAVLIPAGRLHPAACLDLGRLARVSDHGHAPRDRGLHGLQSHSFQPGLVDRLCDFWHHVLRGGRRSVEPAV